MIKDGHIPFYMHPAMLSIAIPSSSPTGLSPFREVRGKSFREAKRRSNLRDCRVSLRSTRNDMLEILLPLSSHFPPPKSHCEKRSDEAIYEIAAFHSQWHAGDTSTSQLSLPPPKSHCEKRSDEAIYEIAAFHCVLLAM